MRSGTRYSTLRTAAQSVLRSSVQPWAAGPATSPGYGSPDWKPADPEAMCNHVYGTVDTNIPLGIDFESGKAYSVVVSDVTETFVAQ